MNISCYKVIIYNTQIKLPSQVNLANIPEIDEMRVEEWEKMISLVNFVTGQKTLSKRKKK
jgi:hypothetical protein